MITKIIHRTFAPPLVSCLRKRSLKTVIRSQIQITHTKNTSIDSMTLRNG